MNYVTQYGKLMSSPTKRPPSLLQQRLAAFDASEREATSWKNRMKLAVYFAVLGPIFVSLLLLAIAFPFLYPRDIEGIGILFGVSALLAAFFFSAYLVQEWVEDCTEWYWFWRISSVLLFLAIASGMLYGMFVTTSFWLPHIH